ncbi:MAG TPA: TIGR00282 family metallophosphoesterase [Dehalococcoidales bacterium]|nr:TIGR00282 family metallophosphoesterase [Dehalococcoidales bacterium]
MKILSIGDIVGKPGRQIVHKLLPGLRKEYGIDFVIANGENAAGGFGLSADTAHELLDEKIDVITSGNHIWAQKDIIPCLESELPILRPLNFPPGVPGRGYIVKNKVLVVNLIGRTFMTAVDCPFRAMDRLLEEISPKPKIIMVDFHAEATSEKVALGRYLDGRVSAVLGTHIHVGTIDLQIFPGGTAHVTDIGMTGPSDSIIGDDIDSVLRRFLTALPHHLTVGKGKPVLNAILTEVDEKSGKAKKVERITREIEER